MVKNLEKLAISALVLGGLSLQPVWGMKDDDKNWRVLPIPKNAVNHSFQIEIESSSGQKNVLDNEEAGRDLFFIRIDSNFTFPISGNTFSLERDENANICFTSSKIKIPPFIVQKILLFNGMEYTNIFLNLLASTPPNKIPFKELFFTMMKNENILKSILKDRRFEKLREALKDQLSSDKEVISGFDCQYKKEDFSKKIFGYAGHLLKHETSPSGTNRR